jgi:predicted aconitase with swiveling domain
VRAGTAPAAIITTGVDSFFALASIVANVMYQSPIPIIAVPRDEFAGLQTGDMINIDEEGRIVVSQVI